MIVDFEKLSSEKVLSMTPEEIVVEYANFVQDIVNKIHHSLNLRIEMEDLEAYGMLGLLEAHSRFKGKKGESFTTYAYYRVRGAIFDGCRKEGWIPRDRKKKARKMRGVDAVLETDAVERSSEKPRTFTDAVSRVTEVVTNAAIVVLMEEESIGAMYDNRKHESQQTVIEKRETKKLLYKSLDALEHDERDLIIRFHFQHETMDAIGESYGYSKSWISRLHKKALKKMYFEMKRLGVESA